MAGLTDAQGSRVFHLMMIVPAVLLLLLSLVSLSTLAVTNKKVIDEATRIFGSNHDISCALYTGIDDGRLEPNDGGECTYSIVAGGILGLLALVLAGVFVAKAIMGIVVISLFSAIELSISAFGTIWAFMVSVTITAGLSKTCSSYAEAFNIGQYPCCSYFFGESPTSESRVYFYEGLNASRITAWLAMTLLLGLTIFYTIALMMYFCGGKTSSRSTHSTAGGDSKSI